ncbi:MAG: hypothetical protein P8H43_07355 [Crocinitomicaceae bacterium]|jgi:hypothetical protein|nr:hypothetical protein [Crocinitomicaceae bacterium]
MINILYIRLKKLLFILFFCALGLTSFGQNKTLNFTGMLVYKVTPHVPTDARKGAQNTMTIFTNDTITRTENYTRSFGKQVTIRHIELNKSYLLITISDTSKFAIQSDLNAEDSLEQESKYTFRTKIFKRNVLGMKAKRIKVNHPDFEEAIEFLYLKKYSNEYLNNFDEIPGLLVKYSIATPNGILDYELVKLERYLPSQDLFGIPLDYERVSIDSFLEQMMDARKLNQE